MATRSLPADVGTLEWLAGETGISVSTMYRLAALDELEEFGVFKVGAQYRVSKPKARKRIHGTDSEPRPA